MVAAHRHPHSLSHHDLPVDNDRFRLYSADSEYSRFRWIDDRREVLDAEHAKVRYRESRACVLLRCQLSLAGEPGEMLRFGGDLTDTFSVCVEDHRCDQTFVDGDSHCDVYTVEMTNPVACPVSIHFRMIGQRVCNRLDDDVVEADLVVVSQLLQLSTHLRRSLGIEFCRQIEGRNGTDGLREPAGDRFPDLGEGNVLVVALA